MGRSCSSLLRSMDFQMDSHIAWHWNLSCPLVNFVICSKIFNLTGPQSPRLWEGMTGLPRHIRCSGQSWAYSKCRVTALSKNSKAHYHQRVEKPFKWSHVPITLHSNGNRTEEVIGLGLRTIVWTWTWMLVLWLAYHMTQGKGQTSLSPRSRGQ
jgi:hypothetical protein